MMSNEPHPRSTAEKSRLSITAVTAIHQRREKAVASEGAMLLDTSDTHTPERKAKARKALMINPGKPNMLLNQGVAL